MKTEEPKFAVYHVKHENKYYIVDENKVHKEISYMEYCSILKQKEHEFELKLKQ